MRPYFLLDGQHLPIYNMFDVDGEATQCIEQAITVVVRYPDDKWQAAWVSAGAIEPNMSN